MANILERYGIKEVADVTFYKINEKGEAGAPVLYLDTLKVSTIEQTAEQAEARGGKGNPPLIIWDYGKEINVTLEDALFSAKSMAIMFGNGQPDNIIGEGTTANQIMKTITVKGSEVAAKLSTTTPWEVNGHKFTVASAKAYEADTGVEVEKDFVADKTYFVTAFLKVEGYEINISANSFPGAYYVTGDTYARSEVTGEDEFFQFIIPKAKVQSENTITLEAEGDPSVFNMSLRVMRPASGEMMKLVKYGAAPAVEG